ncbi:MAG: hypothetical protein ACREP6_04490, partial [Candidatus Binataceae bacterium]
MKKKIAVASLCALIIGLFCPHARPAQSRRHTRGRPTPAASITPGPSATPSAVPTATPTPAMRPVVLLTGGTGLVEAPTGESPAVLNTAEIYEPMSGQFFPLYPMAAHRDRQSATMLRSGRVLITGGVNTILVPMILFPGPSMPWILSSTEIFDPKNGRFTAGAKMLDPRDEPTATLLQDGKVLIVGGGTRAAALYDPAKKTFAPTGKTAASRYGQT